MKEKCKMKVLVLTAFLFLSNLMFAQQKNISGTVTDSKGEPIIGASILAKGSTSGTITDLDGKFTLGVPSSTKVLVVSYVGMKTQEVSLSGSTVKVVLEDDAKTLDDVVVIGFGSVRKKDLTGSVASIKSEALASIPVSNVSEALTGKLAGVRLTTTDGSPDAEVLIRVRGGGSITGDNSPLFIVDGFPVDNINDIPSNDIEDITVLRDASSTAIYGSRGANGVILVTTKKTDGSKTRVNYNGFVQSKTIANRLKSMNTYDYVMSNYEYALLRGSSSVNAFVEAFGVYDDYDLYKSVKAIDWQQDMFGASVLSQQHNLSIMGGNKTTSYSLSGNYDYNGGLMVNNDYTRYAFQFKLNHEISKKLKFSLNARVNDQLVNGSGTQGGTYKIRTSQAITSVATRGLSDFITVDTGSMTDEEYQEYLENNLSLSEQAQRYWRRRNDKGFNFNSSLDWTVFKGFTAHLEAGYGYGFNELKNWWGATTTNASYAGGLPLADFTKTNTTKFREAFTLTYDFNINAHKFNVMVGNEISTSGSNYTYMSGTKYSAAHTAEQVFAKFGLAGETTVKSFINRDDKLASFFGRVNYSLNDKYLLTLTMREDGSSKFESGHRWGFFPAGAFGWRVIEEPFMASMKDVMSNLKLRFSYGTAGNNRIASDLTTQVYVLNSGAKRYGVGDAANNHYSASSSYLSNPNLRWEKTITRDWGLDFGFFNERINGTVDYYWNTAKDLLIPHAITAPGYTMVYENSAQTSSRGIELSLNLNLAHKKKFTFDTNFNIGFNKSMVDELAGGLDYMSFASGWAGTDNKNQEDYIVRVGNTVGLIYGWQTEGYYTTNDFDSYNAATNKYTLKSGVANTSLLGGAIGIRPGTMKLKDISGANGTPDGVVDSYDRVVIGDTNPLFQGGFGFSSKIYDFDLAANFTFTVGNDVYNANKIASSQQYRSGTYPNMLDIMRQSNSYSYMNPETGELLKTLEELAQWNEGANAKQYWSPYSVGSSVVVPTDWAIEDASFLRLQSVTLGYTLPKKLLSKIRISNLRVYATASNLFVITNYSGYDPEVSSYSRNSAYSSLTPGIDYSSYPKSRGYTFGVNVSF